MPLLCFACFRSRDLDDSTSILDFEVSRSTPRLQADEPPPLSSTATNLFDTFPRIVYGGYRRYYYERACMKQAYDLVKNTGICRSEPFEPSLSAIAEDPWSWQHLPNFTGRKPRRRVRKSHSSLRNACPQLRKKPRFRPSAIPLVDTTYPWPNWSPVKTQDGESETGSTDSSASIQSAHSTSSAYSTSTHSSNYSDIHVP
ncbi:hypothetical protein B0H11DRAFT_1971054 [Mycena galericulata]|nr:hypothetical protein B0H11DRAFT_1971054 [Mycena galericulata]